MRFVEAVAREFRHQLEDIFGAAPLDAVADRALDEALLLRRHLLLDLLAHGAPKQVGLAEREAGEHLGDLHHLLLVDDDAVGLAEDRRDHVVQALDALAPVLAVHIGVDVVHRARAVQRHDGDDVLEAVGLELPERIAHALTFELEHADRVALLQQRERRRVVERQLGGIDVDTAPGNQLPRRLDHGERLEAEEIELHQPRGFGPFHAELGCRQLRARIAVERHEVDQRPVGDDHARGMGRGVAVKTLEPLADIEQLRHDRLGVARLLQPRLGGDGLRQGDGIGGVHRHELAEPIDLAVGHLQHAADVAQHRARLELAEGDDVGHAMRAVAFAHIGDHLVAAVLAEVDVEIGHRHALWIEEALEQQPEADRIEIGDGERISDERARAGAATGPDGDAFGLGPFDEVGDDQEVALIVHAGDDIELEGEPLGVGRRVEARRHAVLGDPSP